MTWQEISKKRGVSIESLREHRIVGHFGHGVNRSVRRFIPTEKQISDIQKYRAEGKSWSEILKVMEINRKILQINRDEGVLGSEHQVQGPGNRKDLTEDQIREVKRLLAEDKNWKEIGKKTGITQAILDRRRNECLFGIEHRVKSYRTPLSEEQISKAKAGLADGEGDKAIAESIHVGREVFQQSKWNGLFGDEYADAGRLQSRRMKKR